MGEEFVELGEGEMLEGEVRGREIDAERQGRGAFEFETGVEVESDAEFVLGGVGILGEGEG